MIMVGTDWVEGGWRWVRRALKERVIGNEKEVETREKREKKREGQSEKEEMKGGGGYSGRLRKEGMETRRGLLCLGGVL